MDVTRFINERAGQETIIYKGSPDCATAFDSIEVSHLRQDGVPSYVHRVRESLYQVAKGSDARLIVELGTREGFSTTAFSVALAERGSGYLYSFDPAWNEPLFRRGLLESCEWLYYELTGEEGYEKLGDDLDNIDLLYIDTDPHERDQTYMFLTSYWAHNVRPGGYIVLDDCSPYFQKGVDRSKVPSFVGNHQLINIGEWGVLQAILEFVEEQQDKIEFAFSLWNHASPGTAIIKLREGCKV